MAATAVNAQQAKQAAQIIRRRLPAPECTRPGNGTDGPRLLGKILATALEETGTLPLMWDLSRDLCQHYQALRSWLFVLERYRVVQCGIRGFELHPSVVAQVLARQP